MSRATTAPTPQTSKPAQSMPSASGAASSLPKEKVALRAYQKWLQSGCKHGCDQQHWMEAEKELLAETAKTGAPATRR